MIIRIAKSVSIAVKVAVISFDRAFNSGHSIDDILGYTDELTGLLNLKAFERDRQKAGKEYALVLIDVDNFKEINDIFGHAFGDAVLKRIGQILGFVASFCGRAYRLHGDEFSLIIQKQEAHRICSEIEEHVRTEDTLSISQGVILIEKENIPFEKLFRLADDALYQSKNRGKGITTIMPMCK